MVTEHSHTAAHSGISSNKFDECNGIARVQLVTLNLRNVTLFVARCLRFGCGGFCQIDRRIFGRMTKTYVDMCRVPLQGSKLRWGTCAEAMGRPFGALLYGLRTQRLSARTAHAEGLPRGQPPVSGTNPSKPVYNYHSHHRSSLSPPPTIYGLTSIRVASIWAGELRCDVHKIHGVI